MHNLFNDFFSTFQARIWHIFYASTIFFLIELVWAHNKYSIKSRLRAGLFWAVYLCITVGAFTFFNALWGRLGVEPLMSFTFTGISESDSPILKYLSWVIIPVGVGIIGEFFYYWFHRLQHTIPFMWRFHEVHHSLREMSSWNSNHHFTEEIFRIPFVVIPMSLLFHFETGTIPVAIGIIMGLQGQYEHSHAKLNLGFLRYVIGDNRFHRIHHSIEKHHYNKNFGSFSTVWDTVFRTAHFPKKDEWPDTGVDGVEEPKTLRQFLFMPFAAKDNAPVESPSFVPQKRKRARSQEA